MTHSKTTILQKVIAIACAAMIAFVAASALAFADTSQADAKTKKKTVYVIASKSFKSTGDSAVATAKFTYNKNGLVAKKLGPKPGFVTTYKYSKKGQLKSEVHDYGTNKIKMTYKYNKKGQLTTKTETGQTPRETNYTTYRYSKGKLTKMTIFYASDPSAKFVSKITCNKAKHITKRVNQAGTFKYAYDKKGNLKQYVHVGEFTQKFTNKYKKSRLVKTTSTTVGANYVDTYTYKYKKIKVPAKMVDKVKAQQWDFINAAVSGKRM